MVLKGSSSLSGILFKLICGSGNVDKIRQWIDNCWEFTICSTLCMFEVYFLIKGYNKTMWKQNWNPKIMKRKNPLLIYGIQEKIVYTYSSMVLNLEIHRMYLSESLREGEV